MAATSPKSLDDLIDLVRKSRLVESSRFDEYWSRLKHGTVPDRPHRLARRMVQDGLLTNFQAEQLLKGKYKGFALGNYRLLERVGRGGMGTVYLAEHRMMRHRVALKILPPEQAENPTTRERFYREARSAAVLNHPGIVRAHDIDCVGGVHYLVMEFVEGVGLHELVTRTGPLGVERAANYIGQAAAALAYAHDSAGMVHRDIKPGNLLVDRTGTVKILDMGLARLGLAHFLEKQTDAITRNYNDRSILGTADYIAPEQAVNSQGVDTRADVYSLGGTFCFLLTGQPPFPGGSTTQKLMWHQLRQPVSVKQLRPEVPDRIADLVARMLAKDPASRPQHPAEVVEVLSPWLEMAIPPPSDDEIPPLCLAARGPMSGSASQSSINLGGRLARSPSRSSVNIGPQTGTENQANVETPVAASQVDLQDVLSAAKQAVPAPTPPPVPPRPRHLVRWLALLAAALLGATGGALAVWSLLAG